MKLEKAARISWLEKNWRNGSFGGVISVRKSENVLQGKSMRSLVLHMKSLLCNRLCLQISISSTLQKWKLNIILRNVGGAQFVTWSQWDGLFYVLILRALRILDCGSVLFHTYKSSNQQLEWELMFFELSSWFFALSKSRCRQKWLKNTLHGL